MFYILEIKMLDRPYFAEHMEVLENGKVFDQSVLDILNDGVSIKNRNLDITFPRSRGKLSNVLDGIFDFTVVSHIILDVLIKNCDVSEFEYFPVKIERKTDLNYYSINILNNIDAFDFEKSEWESYTKEIPVLKSISKLVLKDDKIKNRHLFRLSKGRSSLIFVSEHLKNELKLLKMPELVFMPSNKYSWDINEVDWGDMLK